MIFSDRSQRPQLADAGLGGGAAFRAVAVQAIRSAELLNLSLIRRQDSGTLEMCYEVNGGALDGADLRVSHHSSSSGSDEWKHSFKARLGERILDSDTARVVVAEGMGLLVTQSRRRANSLLMVLPEAVRQDDMGVRILGAFAISCRHQGLTQAPANGARNPSWHQVGQQFILPLPGLSVHVTVGEIFVAMPSLNPSPTHSKSLERLSAVKDRATVNGVFENLSHALV